MVIGFAEVFPSINPIKIRYEKLTDVIRLQNRLNKYASHMKKKAKKGNVIMRPASDNCSMKIDLKFDGFDKMLRDIEKMGGSSKVVAENALKKARDQINSETKAGISKHHRTGMTESSIKDAPIEWDGLVAKIPIGFDINNGGYPSIFLIYGTPKMKKDEELSRILDKRKGYRDKVLKEKMEDEYEKIMK